MLLSPKSQLSAASSLLGALVIPLPARAALLFLARGLGKVIASS